MISSGVVPDRFDDLGVLVEVDDGRKLGPIAPQAVFCDLTRIRKVVIPEHLDVQLGMPVILDFVSHGRGAYGAAGEDAMFPLIAACKADTAGERPFATAWLR